MNGIGISSSTAGSAPTAMYRPNFSQAFQRAGPYPLFPGATPFGTGTGLLTNGKLKRNLILRISVDDFLSFKRLT